MDVVTFALLKKKLDTKASLVNGKVPAEELPSYVDDAVEFDSVSDFPENGEEGKIYIAKDTGYTYRWSGSQYVQIGGQDLSDYYTKTEIQTELNGKQDKITNSITLGSTTLDEATLNRLLALLPPPLPIKGQIISMNLDGTARDYRVLSINDTVAKVVAMFDGPTSQKFNTSSKTIAFSDGTVAQQYMGSDLDTYLNETWYNTLNADAKAAIVEVDLTQDLWKAGETGNPMFYRISSNGDRLSFSKMTGTSPIGKRKIYALSVQDVVDYLELSSGANMTWQSIMKMFYNEEQVGIGGYPWFSSADGTYSSSVYYLYSTQGYISTMYNNYSYSWNTRPAFCLDLTKINYTIVE